MTELTKHAKDILRAIADGKKIQINMAAEWGPINTYYALDYVNGGDANILRIAPETRSINGVVFAAPVKAGRGCFSIDHIEAFKDFRWPEPDDVFAAFEAIIDALEGRTK